MGTTHGKAIVLSLVLVLTLSLCACAQKPHMGAAADKPSTSAGGETLPNMTDRETPERQPGESDTQPAQAQFSAEAEQSLVWLRDRMDFPQTMFGVALLGYTGEASDGDWLSEVDQAMLQKYPFLSEIDAEHTIGNDDYLYCLVPIDENATVSVNLTQWDPKTDTEEIIEVLYRSEVGDPLSSTTQATAAYGIRSSIRRRGTSCHVCRKTGIIFPLTLLNTDGRTLLPNLHRGWQTAGAGSTPPDLRAAGRRRRRHGIRTKPQITTCGSSLRMRTAEV